MAISPFPPPRLTTSDCMFEAMLAEAKYTMYIYRETSGSLSKKITKGKVTRTGGEMDEGKS